MRACSQIPECSISYTKILQGESNGKEGKRSFTALDTAEPKHILYKDMKLIHHGIFFLTLKKLNNTY